jgi:anti-sigma B factor antagonist
MTIESFDLPDGTCRVVLVGRFDIAGAQEIDLDFNVLAGAKRRIVVDLEGVTFLASMGLRTLLTCAKAIGRKGGHMVLFRPDPNVEKVLLVSGTSDILPIFNDFDEAVVAAAG